MNDLFDIRPSNKEMAVAILVVFICLVGAGFIGYMLGIRNVHDNGAGTQPITNELGQVGTAIENAGAGIHEAQGRADKVGAGIESAKESAEYIHSTANTSGELISECKSIIEGIRARGHAAKTQD